MRPPSVADAPVDAPASAGALNGLPASPAGIKRAYYPTYEGHSGWVAQANSARRPVLP